MDDQVKSQQNHRVLHFLALTLSIFGVLALGIAIGYLLPKKADGTMYPTVADTNNTRITSTPTATNAPTHSVTQTPTQSSSKTKAYTDTNFNISFQYPENWTVEFIENELTSDRCANYKDLWKPTVKCGDIKNSGFLRIEAPQEQATLILGVPGDSTGYPCDENNSVEPRTQKLTIKGTAYTKKYCYYIKDVSIAISEGSPASTTPKETHILSAFEVPTGTQSKWKNFDISSQTANKQNFDQVIKVIESIK